MAVTENPATTENHFTLKYNLSLPVYVSGLAKVNPQVFILHF